MNLARLRFRCQFLSTLLLGTTLCFTLPSYKAIAQQSSPPPVEKSTPSLEKSSSPQPLTEETAGLLVRSIQTFFTPEQLETKSQFKIEGTLGAVLVRLEGRNHNILKSPHSFRTEFEFQDPINPTQVYRKYVVISNGKTLWTYCPDTQQYSTQPYPLMAKLPNSLSSNPFKSNSFNIAALGFMSTFYVAVRDKFSPMLADKTNTSQAIQKIIKDPKIKDMLEFRGYQSVENQGEVAMYRLTVKVPIPSMPKTLGLMDDPYVELWIHPKTEKLTKLQMVVQYSSNKMKFRVQLQENMSEQQTLTSIPTDTFYFKPPKGSKLVKNLPLMPL
jgi:outer membrane lipoprotein-sorting protein